MVVATGSEPTALAGSSPAAAVLAGTAAVTGPVVVLDFEGHRKGGGVAEVLATGGLEVTLVALGAPRARGARELHRGMLALRRLAALGVRLVEGHRLVSIEDGAVHLARVYDGTPLVLACRTVVHASPHTPADGLVRDLRAGGTPVRAIGDARAPRLVEDAIADGYRAALAL